MPDDIDIDAQGDHEYLVTQASELEDGLSRPGRLRPGATAAG